jgi:DNA-binding NtrC family response regulator
MQQYGPKALILCVDDEDVALRVRTLVLERNGYDVVTAHNCEEAIRAFRRDSVALVLTDYLLGTESGVDLAAELKHMAPGVPVILLSGMMPSNMEHIDSFITKGESVQAMLDAIQAMLNNSGVRVTSANVGRSKNFPT